ncbi:MAG: hypothetical protein MUC96_22425 [Myxococcaceae bacterium]|jgi:hypothetical protein|nr:hypothetical protein [Myxococcaceae bacterium]
MSVIARVVLVFTLAGCGSPVVGTWQVSTTIMTETAQGGTETQTLTDTLRIESAGWRVGGGCLAPLRFDGARASLSQATRCTPFDRADAVFTFSAIGRTWMSGDQLDVSRAEFSIVGLDRLSASVRFRIGRGLDDPLSGTNISFEAADSMPLQRAK